MDDRINDVLRARLRGGEGRQEPLRDLVRGSVAGASGFVDGLLQLVENRCDIGTWFDDDGVDALRSEFVVVGLGEGLESKLASAVQTNTGNPDAAGAAANVD